MKNEKTLKNWLITPFRFIAGTKSLVLGLCILALLSVLGYLSNTYFDGALDIHYGATMVSERYPVHAFLVFSGWAALTIVFYITARIVSSSSVRLVDIAGTMALAKTPFIIAALWGLLPIAHLNLGNLASVNVEELLKVIFENMSTITLTAVVVLIPVVWFFALMYNAYTVSANVKGQKAIISFIIAVVVSEIISKALIIAIMPLL